MGRRRRRKKGPAGLKQECIDALAGRRGIEARAAHAGLLIAVNEVGNSCGRRPTLHWMFNGPNGRVLDWWPGTGTWRGGGKAGKAPSAGAALDVAIAILQDNRKVVEMACG